MQMKLDKLLPLYMKGNSYMLIIKEDISRLLSLILHTLFSLCLLSPVAQARASNYISTYSASIIAIGSGKVSVQYNIIGTDKMEEIGSTTIIIYENGIAIKTFQYTTTPSMIAYYIDYHSDSVTYSELVDASGAAGGKLKGAYGQQMNITVTISNHTGASRKFRVYLGSSSGNHAPVYVYGGTKVSYNNPVTTSRYFYDIIESDAIPNGGSAAINFFSALPGGTNTPYSFGVRPM